jgi:hypothetical protein
MRWQKAHAIVDEMWTEGYCGLDIVGTLFRVTKFEEMSEPLKLDFIKVGDAAIPHNLRNPFFSSFHVLLASTGNWLYPYARAGWIRHVAADVGPHRKALLFVAKRKGRQARATTPVTALLARRCTRHLWQV